MFALSVFYVLIILKIILPHTPVDCLVPPPGCAPPELETTGIRPCPENPAPNSMGFLPTVSLKTPASSCLWNQPCIFCDHVVTKEGQTRKHLRISFLIDVQGITIFTFLIIRLKCIILHSKIYIYCLFSWGFPPKEIFFHF